MLCEPLKFTTAQPFVHAAPHGVFGEIKGIAYTLCISRPIFMDRIAISSTLITEKHI